MYSMVPSSKHKEKATLHLCKQQFKFWTSQVERWVSVSNWVTKFGSDWANGGRQRENVVCKRVRCARAFEQGGKIAISVFELQKSWEQSQRDMERTGLNWKQIKRSKSAETKDRENQRDQDWIGARWIEKELSWVMIQRSLSLGSWWEGESKYKIFSTIFCIACCWDPLLLRVHLTITAYISIMQLSLVTYYSM